MNAPAWKIVTDEASDAELVARARAGEDLAFAQLMTRHKTWLHRFVLRYIGRDEDALDLVQESFFAAWLALSRYDPERPFGAWLRRIALNKCRDRSRREKVRRMLTAVVGSGEELPDVVDDGAGPERLAESSEELVQIAAAIRKLPRTLKEPLLLTALEGLSHREAGELLGLNPKAIEMRVYRARAQLEDLLAAPRTPSSAY